MSLPATNITTALVRAEIGVASNLVSALVGASGLNMYSRYAPGTVGIVGGGNYNLQLVPPSSNFKLGDFRLYDHAAIAPHWWSMGAQYWGPGGSTHDTTILIAMEQLNLAAIAGANEVINSTVTPWIYRVRVNVYNSAADRIAETALVKAWYPIEIDMVNLGFTVLSGHTRDMAGKYIMNTGYSGNQFLCDGTPVSAGNCTRYFEAFFCDSSGIRKMNFGASRDLGYIDVNYTQFTIPAIVPGVHTGTNPGAGWTGFTFPEIYTANSPKCSSVSSINMTFGDNGFSFYLGLYGMYSLDKYMIAATADVRMTRTDPIYGTESQIIASGVSLLNSAKIQINGMLTGWSKGNTWFNSEQGVITIENITYGTYSIC